MVSYMSKVKSLLLHLMSPKYKVKGVQIIFNYLRNKFRENTSEMKTPLMSKAFIPPNRHILSFLNDTHPPTPWNPWG